MKFLIIAARFHTNLYYRTKALQDAGHIVKVAVLYQGKSEYYKETDFVILKLSTFSRLLSLIIKIFKKKYLKSSIELGLDTPGNELNKIFDTYLPDVVLLKAYQNLLAIKSLILAKKHKAKVLMLTQTPYNHIKGSSFLFKLNIRLFKFLRVFAYITPIKINYDVFKKSGIENVHYFPFVFPVNTKHIKPVNDEIKILCIGKFQKRKNQLQLLKVLKELVNEQFSLKLCLIGELADVKYYEKIQQFIVDNSLTDKVCLKVNLSYTAVQEEYKNHDLFVLPAYNEPAAYSPVEAMANALPVICSDENGTKCYIKDGKNGYIFKSKNKNDLKEKIINCISDKEKLRKMQKNALFSAKENHNPDNFAKNIIKILK